MIKSAMDFHHQIITYAGCTTKKSFPSSSRGSFFVLNDKVVINHGYSRE